MRALVSVAVSLSAISLVACGPSKMSIPPAEVTRIDVRPTAGQRLFCPGDPFQIEVVAKMKDGTSCSSVNGKLGCKGKSDAVIDPQAVRIQAWPAQPIPSQEYTWSPDANPLLTAGTGLTLKAWLEDQTGKSVEGTSVLKPVYSCPRQVQLVFEDDSPINYGAPGRPGPELNVSVTPLSTPWYANAALIRVDVPAWNVTRYAISPSSDKPVTVISRGQDGGPGQPGKPGTPGQRGTDATVQCGTGGRGGDGQPGGPGGPGGNGGNGGVIHVFLDSTAYDKVNGRVLVRSIPGEAGPGGHGGPGGAAGQGGSGGSSGQGCYGQMGQNGNPGQVGAPGPAGAPGNAGPPPSLGTVPRPKLFAAEMKLIQEIEATPAHK